MISESKEPHLKKRTLLYNARVLTQAHGLRVNSIAFSGSRITAVGNRLEHDPDFKGYARLDLKGRTVIPGLVDAHTHFFFFAQSLGIVSVQNEDSIDRCLEKIKAFAAKLKNSDWVVGEGYAPDRFRKRIEPDRLMLDSVTGERPAFIFSKDQHTAWVNSKALAMAGIDAKTPDPRGGEIARLPDGTPSGILREGPAIGMVFDLVPQPTQKENLRRYNLALDYAYRKGVTGVHSFDGPEGFVFYSDLAEKGKTGLRINYYPPAWSLPDLEKSGITFGTGTEFFRICGVKIFADGSLGSQSALCFNKYVGSKDNYGIEVTTVPELKRLVKRAGRLGLPCAIHAIGDRAVSNVLDAFEQTPGPKNGARHRIEHLQLIRRKDVRRVRNLKVVASMQPSHCPSDIHMARQYWGKRAANAFIFRTLLDSGVDLAFGSDVPIEPLDPIVGVAHAVRRARPHSRDVFYPEQRIGAAEALFGFTVGPAIAANQAHNRGYLLPGYPADFVITDRDFTSIAASQIYDTEVLATVIDGTVKYCDRSVGL